MQCLEVLPMNALNHLSLRQRLVGLSALLGVMVLIPLAALVNARIAEWRFNEAEMSGLAPADALIDMTAQLQRHRGLSAPWLLGNAPSDAPRQAVQVKLHESYVAFERAWTAAHLDGKALDQARGVMTEFDALASRVDARGLDNAESFDKHTALIDRLQQSLFKVMAASQLLYDPVDYTYLLIIAGYQESPRITELAARMRGLGTAFLTNHEGLASDVKLAGDTHGRLLERIGHLQTHWNQVAESRPDLNAEMIQPALLKAAMLSKLSLDTRGMLEGDNQSPVANMSPKEYFKHASKPIDEQIDTTHQIGSFLKQSLRERQSDVERALTMQAVVAAVLACLCLWAMVSISRSITVPVNRMKALAESLGRGDLTISCATERSDEIGSCMRALETARLTWVDMLADLRDMVDDVSAASDQISAGSDELNERTLGVATALKDTTSAIGSLDHTVRRTAESADQAHRLARSAQDAAGQGELVMGQVVSNMDNIASSSRRIGDILSVIDGIAFQTNILALNAAVEAARAGESGRGFAVVAAEVRSLAQRSATAAKEIKDLIEDSTGKVEAGTTLVQAAGRSMQAIMDSNAQVSTIVGTITAATQQQTQGFAQVSLAMAEVDGMTSHNRQLVEQSSTAAQSLQTQAERLTQKMNSFRFEAGGGSKDALDAAQAPARSAASASADLKSLPWAPA